MENKRKIFFIAILLGVLVLAGYVVAQARQPNQCCRIRAAFTVKQADGFKLENKNGGAVDEADLENDDVVGAQAIGGAMDPANPGGARTNPWCDLDRDGVADGDFELYSKDWGMICFLSTVHLITKWIFIILMAISTIMIIYGGFLYVASAGDPEKAGKGKSVLTFAIIGLAIALLARVIPSLLRFVIGV